MSLEPVERVIGIGARGERLDQARKHRFERLLRRRRAERARLARAPVGDVPGGRVGVGEAQLPQLALRMSGSLDNCPRSPGARLSKISPAASTWGRSKSSRRRSVFKPVQPRDIVERGRIARKQMRLRILDHLNAVLDRAQQPIGFGERRSPFPPQAGPAASSAWIASRVAGTRTEGSRPPWIICWIWTKNSTSRIPPRPRFKS